MIKCTKAYNRINITRCGFKCRNGFYFIFISVSSLPTQCPPIINLLQIRIVFIFGKTFHPFALLFVRHGLLIYDPIQAEANGGRCVDLQTAHLYENYIDKWSDTHSQLFVNCARLKMHSLVQKAHISHVHSEIERESFGLS